MLACNQSSKKQPRGSNSLDTWLGSECVQYDKKKWGLLCNACMQPKFKNTTARIKFAPHLTRARIRPVGQKKVGLPMHPRVPNSLHTWFVREYVQYIKKKWGGYFAVLACSQSSKTQIPKINCTKMDAAIGCMGCVSVFAFTECPKPSASQEVSWKCNTGSNKSTGRRKQNKSITPKQ